MEVLLLTEWVLDDGQVTLRGGWLWRHEEGRRATQGLGQETR